MGCMFRGNPAQRPAATLPCWVRATGGPAGSKRHRAGSSGLGRGRGSRLSPAGAARERATTRDSRARAAREPAQARAAVDTRPGCSARPTASARGREDCTCLTQPRARPSHLRGRGGAGPRLCPPTRPEPGSPGGTERRGPSGRRRGGADNGSGGGGGGGGAPGPAGTGGRAMSPAAGRPPAPRAGRGERRLRAPGPALGPAMRCQG